MRNHQLILSLCLYIVLWHLPCPVNALQVPNIYFKSFGVEDGLSQNMIYAILQDKSGFMWFATQDGLNRYDGNSFKIYRKNTTSRYELKTDAIFSLAEDAQGILWIGTDCGVYLNDPVLDCITPLTLKTSEGLSVDGIVRDIKPDYQGNMWLVVSDKGVFCVTPQRTLLFYSLTQYIGNAEGMVRDLCPDMEGNIWIATYQQGIFKLTPSTGELKQYLIAPFGKGVCDNDVNDLCLLHPDILLVGTINKGLLQLNLRKGTFSPVLEKGEDGKTLFVRSIYTDNSNNIWLGTETGVYIYSWKERSTVHLQHVLGDPYSLSDNAIHSIYRDREGGIWLGTFFGGVNYFTESYAWFEKYYPVSGANSIGGKSISEFCEDESGNIWIGTEDGGLNCFDPVNRTFTKGFIPAENIHALFYDDNHLWIGSFSKGLFVMNLKTKQVKNYRSSSEPGTLKSDNIYSIYKDSFGSIWIGTMKGLYRYMLHTDSFESICEKEITTQVNDILEDTDGVLWFATLGQGLFSYDRKRNAWNKHSMPTGKDDTRNKMVVCIIEDKYQGLWMGTEGAGLAYYDKQKHAFTKHYGTADGLPNNVIYQLLEDINGCIWGSTNKGLFMLNPQTKKVKKYNHSDGLLGDQFNYKSGIVTRNAKMYFGGIKGFIAFEPYKLVSSQIPPNIVFNSFQLYNEEVPAGVNGSPLKKSITHTKEIVLSNDQSTFSIGFSVLSYASPLGNNYAYKLENWDRDWIYVGQSRQVTYSHLPPGQYRFVVKASNSDEQWKEVSMSVDIKVRSPFYQTFWAYLSYAFILILLGYWLVRSYTLRLQKRNVEAMKNMEHAKEKELYNAKINFFTNITHEIRTPLSLIKAPLEEVMKEIQTSDGCYENLSIIRRNTNRLLKLVNELLDFRKAEVKGLRLNLVHTDVTQIIKETMSRFVPTAHFKKIMFQEDFPEHPVLADVDVEVLTKILSNLFNNALKHADTFIKVSLESISDNFRLIVSNDGNEIPSELVNRIFDPFVKLDENSQGTGLGLPFAKTLVETHKGCIYIDREQSDVTFVVELPLCQEGVICLKDIEEENQEYRKEVLEANKQSDANHRISILLVEDNEEFRNFMVGQLKKDYHVLQAGNGKQALEMLSEKTVDIVISDVMMPVMDGMSLCQIIKEDIKFSHIPVILLTAKTGLQPQIDGLKAGADEYITKPHSIDFLKARIENLLVNRKKIREVYRQSPESTVEAIAYSKADEEFLNKLVDSIHSHLEEVDLNVDTLAVDLNMSRATMYRKVRSISELTPNDFIRLIRLKKAAELLQNKEYRVNEVAFIVGFSSSSYFAKCFYKQFGVLPKDFERKNRAENIDL